MTEFRPLQSHHPKVFFKKHEDAHYWVFGTNQTTGTLPVVWLKWEHKEYVMGVFKLPIDVFLALLGYYEILSLLVDPFRRGVHLVEGTEYVTLGIGGEETNARRFPEVES